MLRAYKERLSSTFFFICQHFSLKESRNLIRIWEYKNILRIRTSWSELYNPLGIHDLSLAFLEYRHDKMSLTDTQFYNYSFLPTRIIYKSIFYKKNNLKLHKTLIDKRNTRVFLWAHRLYHHQFHLKGPIQYS